MNTMQTISSQSKLAKSASPIDAQPTRSAHHIRPAHPRGRASSIIGPLALMVLAGVLSSAAFGANPIEQIAKAGTTSGGMDPHGDSWASILSSIEQFTQPQFILRLLLSFILAVACAWVVAAHPSRPKLGTPLSDTEERKTLIVLSVVGAVIAELTVTNQTLAFVIFGIGALLRFRTALDNPKLTGKAIIVVIIGLACGMGSWAMAVFVTAFVWLLIFWLESNVSCRMRVRLEDKVDAAVVYGAVQSLLVSNHCQLQSSELNEAKGQMVFRMLIPSGIDPKQLEVDVRAQLPHPENSRIDIKAV